MFSDNNSKLPPSIERWLANNKLKVEIYLSGVVLVIMLLRYAAIGGSEEAFMISMSSLAMLYFLLAYAPADVEGLLGLIAYKILGISSSVCVIGLLFSSMHLTGANEMMTIGFLAMAVSGIIISIIAFRSSGLSKLTPLIIRVAVIGAILVATQLF